MPAFEKFFMHTIRKHYPAHVTGIISNTESNYQIIFKDIEFARTSKNPIDKRLDFCAYFLALIISPDKKGESFDTIRTVCLEVVTAYVQPGNALHRAFKRAIPKLISTSVGRRLIKAFSKRVSSNGHDDGFVAEIITDPKQTYGLGYGVDIKECGICKLFAKHNYKQYASILCEVDEITSGLAGLKLIRSGTIANGAPKCDFRYQRI